MLVTLATVGLTAVHAVFFVWVVRGYARRRLLDQPNERSSHERPTPRGGGLGMVVALLPGALFALGLGVGVPGWVHGLAGCIAAMAALGWLDDHYTLSAKLRFPVQALIITATLWLIGLPDPVYLFGFVLPAPEWWLWCLAVVSTLWFVNLYNFMDGIDGIAGSQGIVGAIGLWLLIGEPLHPVSLLLAATAGACAGFLVWNWAPAKIFMGDVGSTALGLVLAIGVVEALGRGVSTELTALCMIPFVWDATATVLRRAWRREGFLSPHRTHLYQRLARAWGSHARVSVLYAALAGWGVTGAWLAHQGIIHPLVALAAGAVPMVILTGSCRHLR